MSVGWGQSSQPVSKNFQTGRRPALRVGGRLLYLCLRPATQRGQAGNTFPVTWTAPTDLSASDSRNA